MPSAQWPAEDRCRPCPRPGTASNPAEPDRQLLKRQAALGDATASAVTDVPVALVVRLHDLVRECRERPHRMPGRLAGEVVLDLHRIKQRLAALRRQLAYAVSTFDSSAVIELPDEGEEPRD